MSANPSAELHDAAGARAIDAWAIDERGTPGVDLMRAAACAAARVVRGRFPRAQRIAVVAGSGGNGGDGFETARLLAAAGCDVRVLRVAGRPPAGAAATTLADAVAAGVPIEEAPDGAIGAALADVDLVVDALLGTGARAEPAGAVAAAIAAIGGSGLPVVALDVPSGVDASTGEAPGVAVQADCTVAFHSDKVGLRIRPGRDLAGDVVVAPIGVPVGAPVPPAAVDAESAVPLVPSRSAADSKYAAGAVLVIGGSVGMAGAPALAAAAALRAGAGVVTVLVPAPVQPVVAGFLREAMVHPLPVADPEAELARHAERADAIVVGPGLGRGPEAEAVARSALTADRPLVVDADALWWAARAPELLAARTAPAVVTPHSGEAARLLGVPSDEIEAHRLRSARALVEATGATAVLKGSDTLVAAPDGRLGVRLLDCAGLATAGSGDVLAGIVGACLARGAEPWTAACAAVAVHVRAGRAATAARRGGAIIAGDLIEHLPVLGRPGSPL